jgi:hypothetical protein
MRARGPGDLENAMRSIERDYGIDYWITWRLRYRLTQCKDIGAAVYARIEAAYLTECERQQRKLAHELAIARKLTDSHLVEDQAVVDDEEASQGLPPPVGEEGKTK